MNDKMSSKLGPMKCIHLKQDKVNIPEYFIKRGIHQLYAQPKLNGIRALWYHHDGLYSRGGHRITSVPHIVLELERKAPNIDLDGELYHDTMPFNRINGAARSIEPTLDSLNLEHHIFDAISEYATQKSRIREVYNILESEYIKRLYTYITRPQYINKDLIDLLAKGYEGIILRDIQAPYREGRHVGNIWAIKPIYEVEAEFLGFLDGETDLHANTFGSMLLKLPNGRTFSCSGFTEDERLRLYGSWKLKRGAEITVKFGAWSHEDPDKAVPLYPRYKCVRWDK
jgi:ATP-dependent DNA ligase